MTSYVHHVPGRLRVRLPALKRNPVLAAELERTIAPLVGVESVQTSVLTGSVLIVYDPAQTDADRLRRGMPAASAPSTCPTCCASLAPGRGSAASGSGTVDALVGMAVEKMLEQSARALLRAFV